MCGRHCRKRCIHVRNKSPMVSRRAKKVGRNSNFPPSASAKSWPRRARAQEIVALAEKRAAQMVEEAKGVAREEGNREKGAAKAEIEQEVARARETLREQVAALVVAGAEKILRREVNAQAHVELLNQLKQEI